MIITLFAGILASSVLTTSLPATPNPAPIPSYSFSQVLEQAEYSQYIVQEGDYLSMIAKEYYGDEDYWTNIWNDNPELENALVLEPNWVLKIRNNKTILPEDLKHELEARLSIQPDTTYTYSQDSGAGIVPSIAVAQPQVQQPAASQGSSPQVLNDAQINYLGNCEAGMDPAKNTGNGYYGAFQFSAGTWNSMGTGYARADQAPIEVQKEAVQRLVARSSIYTQFPGCARKMQSAGII